MFRRLFPASVLLVTLQSSADAFVTRFNIYQVAQNEIPGFSTYDVMVTGTDELKGGTGLLNGMQMLLELYEGSIYQDPMGTTTPPSPFLIPLYPTLEFDTFVGAGCCFGPSIVQGGADGLGGESEVTFDESRLDIAWAPVIPVYTPNDLFVARITISNDAYGSLKLLGRTLGEPDYVFGNDFFPYHGDPAIFTFPSEGSIISLDTAIMASGGVLADAIKLSQGFGGPAVVTGASLADGSLFAVEDVSGQEIDFESNVLVDVAFTGFSGHGLSPGTVVSDLLTIETTYGSFHYTLAATIPVPEPSSYTLALLGVATVGFFMSSGNSRR